MPSKRPRTLSTSASGVVATAFKIKNKHRRSTHNVALRTTIAKAKRQARFDRRKAEARDPTLRKERLKQNVPQTLDSKRVAVDQPWVPSTEMMERAKRKRQEMEEQSSSSSSSSGVDSDSESDEELRAFKKRMDLKRHTKNLSTNIEGGKDESSDEEQEEDDENSDEEGSEEEGSEEDDSEEDVEQRVWVGGKKGDEEGVDSELGSLYDSESDDDRHVQKKSKKDSKKSDESSILPEETLKTLLSLIPHPTKPPRLLITSTRSARRHTTYTTLATIFPNCKYVPRGTKFTLPKIAGFASNRDYSHLLVGVEDSKHVHGLIVIVLPAGPTFHFSLTNFADGKAIQGRGVNTNHVPELILNNFTTPIGRLTASVFQSLYPPQPQFQGRQVVTLHNQRDYIFFRFHRYVFRSIEAKNKGVSRGDRTTGADAVGVGGARAGEDLGVKVGLQELGPQFTLKLRRVERGICEGIEWEWKGRMEKNRKMFHL